MQKKDRSLTTQTPEMIDDTVMNDTSKVNILIKKFANAMKEAGIPNCIIAWDAAKSRYVYAGAMPEEIGDGTQYSSMELDKFVRFLELCTDFDKNDYRFNL